MIIKVEHKGKTFKADLSKPICISLPLSNENRVNAFNAPPFKAEPVRSGEFIGAIEAGSPVNFFNVQVNPHGNGTHTECCGHIMTGDHYINKNFNQFHFIAKLVSLQPESSGDDMVITSEQLKGNDLKDTTALIIRTLPNSEEKTFRNYSGSNPPYFRPEAIKYLVDNGIEHLLTDLPSVDKEKDGGAILSHKAFWNYPEKDRTHCTITELIYVPNEIADGLYLLNIQIAPFELDVSPSNIIMYQANPV